MIDGLVMLSSNYQMERILVKYLRNKNFIYYCHFHSIFQHTLLILQMMDCSLVEIYQIAISINFAFITIPEEHHIPINSINNI